MWSYSYYIDEEPLDLQNILGNWKSRDSFGEDIISFFPRLVSGIIDTFMSTVFVLSLD